MSLKLKKNDIVEVITGEERGRRGKILEIIRDKETGCKIIVEGLNLAKKHQKTRSARKPGGIIDLPQPIHISNLALICPKCGKRTKIRKERIEEKRVRVCKLCDEVIDK